MLTRRLILFLAATASLPLRADWVEYRSEPFHVFSDAGDRAGRERLTQLEQLRFVLGALLGKDGMSRTGTPQELTAVWPIHLVLFEKQKDYTAHVLNKPIVDGAASQLAAWTADTGKTSSLPPDLLRAVTQILINDNAGRMTDDMETALADLLSTIEVTGTRVRIGAKPDGLPPGRLRAWAKLQMMATQPAYTGKLRVYLNNLQNAADEDTASRNSFEMTVAKLNAAVDAYMKAGIFEPAPINGRALNPNRDFIEKTLDKTAVASLMADLSAGGKQFPPESPRGQLASGNRASLELAIRANPRWAEPHIKMADLETDPARKVAELKLAASLAPRNASNWQTLAQLQSSVGLFADAEKSWTAAERAAGSSADREKIHQAKLVLEDQRAAALIAERNRAREEEARDLQRVKDAAAEEVRAAERRVNERLRAGRDGNADDAKPIPLSSLNGDVKGETVAGTLTSVDCLRGPIRLNIKREDSGIAIRLLIRDPKKLTVALDSGDVAFACGVQKPAKKVELEYELKADAKTGTVGDVTMVKSMSIPEESSNKDTPQK